MRVKAGKLARHAARRLERLAAAPPDRGNSYSIPTGCNAAMSRPAARKLCLRAFEPARRMRRQPPVLTPQNRAICRVADSHYR